MMYPYEIRTHDPDVNPYNRAKKGKGGGKIGRRSNAKAATKSTKDRKRKRRHKAKFRN